MKSYRSLSCAAALLIFLMAGTSLCAQSDQPSLADIARQKSGAKARRVVTNDQIPPSPEANNPPASLKNAVGAAVKPSAPAANQDAAAKPATTADPKTRVQQLTAENSDLLKVIAKLQEKIETTGDSHAISSLGEAVQHAKHALAENQAELERLNAANQSSTSLTPEHPPASTQQGSTR